MDLVGVIALACVVPVASADDLVLGRPTCRVDNPSFILVAAAAALVVVAGGKVLRDVIADQIPEVLRDAQNYASAAPLPAVHSRMSFSLISTSNVLAAFWIPIIATFAARIVILNLGSRTGVLLSRSRGPVTGGAIGAILGGVSAGSPTPRSGSRSGPLLDLFQARSVPGQGLPRQVSAAYRRDCWPDVTTTGTCPSVDWWIAHRVVGPREATPTTS